MSTVTYNAFFATQWCVYLVRLALKLVYGVLQFISKPGSRLLVPLALAALAYMGRAELHDLLNGFIDGWNRSFSDVPRALSWAQQQATRAYYGHTTEPWILDAIIVALWLSVTCLYAVLSRLLPILLGAFPQVTTPLRPMRRLVSTPGKVASAPVKVVVPKLRR